MDHEIRPLTGAADLWHRAKDQHDILTEPRTISIIRSSLELDDPISAVNIGIVLRERALLDVANELFQRIVLIEPDNVHGHYNYSHSLLRSDRHIEALHFATKAARLEPGVLRFVLHHVKLLAGVGDTRRAESELNRYAPQNADELTDIRAAHQFNRYLAAFPRSMTDATIDEVERGSSWNTDEAVADAILTATSNETPFSIVRLGDGEGAWMFLSNTDEADYPDLYQKNRASFLQDWFGSSSLLHSSPFHRFARNLRRVVEEADIVGIPDKARIRHEYRILSERGVASSVNVFRFLRLPDNPAASGRRYTSNNVHMHLAGKKFFHELWKSGKSFGVITSHRDIPDMLRGQAKVKVRHEFLTPGDSRNFWTDGEGRPLVQFPEVFENISSRLASLDLRGVVFLVAAGFVGKQYLSLIRRQGGVALDIGGVANTWARSGLGL